MDYKEWLRTLSNRDLHYLIDRQEKIMKQIPKECCIERRTNKIKVIQSVIYERSGNKSCKNFKCK